MLNFDLNVKIGYVGKELYELKKYNEAIEYYDKAIAINQKNTKYWLSKCKKQN